MPKANEDAEISLFADWIIDDDSLDVGDVEFDVVIDCETRARAVARELAMRVRRGEIEWSRVLERISKKSIDGLLEVVITDFCKEIRDSFPLASGRPVFDQKLPAKSLVHWILGVSSNDPRYFQSANPKLFDFLVEASKGHQYVIRHLLTLASVQSEVLDDAASRKIWKSVAAGIESIYRDTKYNWWHNWWPEPGMPVIELASAMAEDIPTERLALFGRQYCDNLPEFFVRLGRVSETHARALGGDPDFVRELVSNLPPVNLDKCSLSHPEYESLLLYGEFSDVVKFVSAERITEHFLAFSRMAAWEIYRRGMPRTPDSISRIFCMNSSSLEGAEISGSAVVWADLLQLASYINDGEYGNEDRIRGVIARLSRSVDLWPSVWVHSTREIINGRKFLGTYGRDLLVLAGTRHKVVRHALKNLSECDSESLIRDTAAGILAHIEGFEIPQEELLGSLSDRSARIFDGIPMVPHALSSVSKTWLGSLAAEEEIVRALKQATVRFGGWTRDQGAAQEELLTGILLHELETCFRETSKRLRIGNNSKLADSVSVKQRPVSKSEEKEWGCDVAFLLHANMRYFQTDLAELVQVKKSEALSSKAKAGSRERWRIDIPQLASLLKMSETSNYWLILSSGEILCVPARVIHGVVKSKGGLKRGTTTVGYADVRHSAISMEQFLPELFLGAWIGSGNEDVLRFANGNDSAITPRYIFDINIVQGDRR